MKRIDALTPEQKARLPEWRDRWIKIGLSTEPADREAAERALRACYQFSNLDGNALEIRWARSPTEMAAGAVRGGVGGAVRDAVRDAVWGAVWGAAKDAVRDSVRDSVWGAVGVAVGDAVWGAIRGAVRDSVRDSVWGAVWGAYFGGQFWADWAAHESFFRKVCDLELSGDFAERAAAHATLVSSVGPILLYRKVAILCERPAAIRLEDGRLHAENQLAVEWRDGTGIAAWRGTVIPSEWTTHGVLTPEIALSHPNVEQRRCAAEMLGWVRILEVLHPSILNEDANPQVGTLLSVNLPDQADARFLRVQCGTGRTFCLPVPQTCATAREANAWTYGKTPDDYAPEVRT